MVDVCRWFLFTDVCYDQPKSLEERVGLASELLPKQLLAAMPVAIDTIENTAETLFAAWPERLFVSSADCFAGVRAFVHARRVCLSNW